MRKITIGILFFLALSCQLIHARLGMSFYQADHPYIQYMGRMDFSNKKLPRFWQPGTCVSFSFKGKACDLIVQDEVLWGKSHNYIQVIVDEKAYRLQLKKNRDTIHLGGVNGKGIHTAILCKNTEANIGYIEFVGIRCKEILKSTPLPHRKIEFIGNSITCGMGNDYSQIPCKTREWYDQHNAWLSYGAITARGLGAQFHLSSVSGIGLMHSCCNLEILMPQVYDKISMRENKLLWDFSKYQPDVVCICLGQNDGIQDSAAFCSAYISFILRLRKYYPNANLLMLSSPMADVELRLFMQKMLLSIRNNLNKRGELQVYLHIFETQYKNGCDSHPDIEDHKKIAQEVIKEIEEITSWKQ